MSVLDQSRDTNGQFMYRLLQTVTANGTRLFEPPEFVKAASQGQIVGADDLPANLYGDPVQRMFPCHTAPATWFSAVCFHTQRAHVKHADIVEKRIHTAGKFHGIAADLDQVKAAAAQAAACVDESLPDDAFALVVTWEDGRKERHLRLTNEAEVKAAQAYLNRFREEFEFADRQVIADKILKQADALGVVVTERAELEKQAGRGTCSAERVATALFQRAQALRKLGRELDLQEKLAGMALEAIENPGLFSVPSNLVKVASLLDQVDRDQGLTKLSTTRPEDLFVLSGDVVQEALNQHLQLVSGSVYAKEALHLLKLADIGSVLGTDLAQRVSDGGLFLDHEKLAEVVVTLPRGDAELFERLLASKGVTPLYKEAATQATKLERTVLQQLAELHTAGQV